MKLSTVVSPIPQKPAEFPSVAENCRGISTVSIVRLSSCGSAEVGLITISKTTTRTEYTLGVVPRDNVMVDDAHKHIGAVIPPETGHLSSEGSLGSTSIVTDHGLQLRHLLLSRCLHR